MESQSITATATINFKEGGTIETTAIAENLDVIDYAIKVLFPDATSVVITIVR